jgi:hypothetical protein
MTQLKFGADFVIIVCGDDSLVSLFGVIYEGDFSMYDQSQFAASLIDGRAFYRRLGIEWDVITVLRQTSAGNFKSIGPGTRSRGGFSGNGQMVVQMATGVGDTSPWNSVTTVVAWLRVVVSLIENCQLGRTQSVETQKIFDGFRRLGLNIKVKKVTPRTATFLKGWWVPLLGGGSAWLPLPSAYIKLGKTLSDPQYIHLDKQERGRASPALAYARHAYALASSLRHVPRDYPILGAFLTALDRLGEQGGRESVLDKHKIMVDEISGIIDQNSVLEMIEERYGLNVTTVRELENGFEQAEKLPFFVSHPAHLKVRGADYA